MSAKSGGDTKGWIFLVSLFLLAVVFTQLKSLFG